MVVRYPSGIRILQGKKCLSISIGSASQTRKPYAKTANNPATKMRTGFKTDRCLDFALIKYPAKNTSQLSCAIRPLLLTLPSRCELTEGAGQKKKAEELGAWNPLVPKIKFSIAAG
jgi:hypothetical protein